VSAGEQVAKLEALLERVTLRRNAPRVGIAAVAADAPSPPAVLEAKAPTPAPAPVQAKSVASVPAKPETPPVPAAVPAAIAPLPDRPTVSATIPTTRANMPEEAIPPAPITPVPATPPAASAPMVSSRGPAGDDEVEVEEGMAEVDLEGLDEGGLSDSVADLDTVAAASADREEVPASSRRPIQLQAQRGELGFNEGPTETKLHPIPPESQRQVAIPAASEAEEDLFKSGVRAMPEIPGAPLELKADVTRPTPVAASPAVFRGAAPEVKPSTFGELLDLTLSL